MPFIQTASTDHLSLDEVITRLSQQAVVDGLIVVGSAAQGEVTAASDYDLVLVLAELPVPMHTGVTYIDGRFTDLLFHTADQVEQILAATEPFDFWDWTGRLVGWLETGQVRFDRHGQLGVVQAKVQSGQWLAAVGDDAARGAWQTSNYNLAVVRRLLTSDDPTYLMAAELRMAINGPQDLFWNYFAVRGLQPDSEKQHIRYLQEHDPAFLADFKHFLAELDRDEKFRRYVALAERVLAPVGPLWQAGETVLNLNGKNLTRAMEKQALNFWEGLTT